LHASSGTEVVDGLRGLAVLLVLGFHTWLFSWLTPSLTVLGISVPVAVIPRSGFLGVDLFFLISGFCLCFPYARARLEGARTPEDREFAERRFMKIVPSYALALAATALATLAMFPGAAFSGPADLAWALFNHALFFNNSYDDPFGQANAVFWSLAIEVQFYLIFPFIVRAFVRRPIVTASAMAAIALAYRLSLAGCCLERETIARQLPAYLDVFACGMLAAYAFVYLRTRLPQGAATRALATLLAIALAGAALAMLGHAADASLDLAGGRERWQLVNRTLLAGVGGATIVASCFSARWWRAAIGNPAFVFLSLISYNLYLWHTLVGIWLYRHGIPHSALGNPHADAAWKPLYVACVIAGSLAIASAITYFIERPLLSLRAPLPFSFDYRRRERPHPAAD
jgi:peptidoglycan/LPS O-acetylase OafA/YrhL